MIIKVTHQHQATNQWQLGNKNLKQKKKKKSCELQTNQGLPYNSILVNHVPRTNIDQQYNIQLTLNVCTKTAKPKLVANAKKMQNYFN